MKNNTGRITLTREQLKAQLPKIQQMVKSRDGQLLTLCYVLDKGKVVIVPAEQWKMREDLKGFGNNFVFGYSLMTEKTVLLNKKQLEDLLYQIPQGTIKTINQFGFILQKDAHTSITRLAETYKPEYRKTTVPNHLFKGLSQNEVQLCRIIERSLKTIQITDGGFTKRLFERISDICKEYIKHGFIVNNSTIVKVVEVLIGAYQFEELEFNSIGTEHLGSDVVGGDILSLIDEGKWDEMFNKCYQNDIYRKEFYRLVESGDIDFSRIAVNVKDLHRFITSGLGDCYQLIPFNTSNIHHLPAYLNFKVPMKQAISYEEGRRFLWALGDWQLKISEELSKQRSKKIKDGETIRILEFLRDELHRFLQDQDIFKVDDHTAEIIKSMLVMGLIKSK